jgi:uncharacterized protein YprB with RNaseH-like and TPR domain
VISTLILDLETTDLDADRAAILCASYESSKEPGKVHTIRQDRTNPRWKKGIRGDDKELVKQTAALVRDHDVIVAHNGNRFDIPMLRTRALRWGLRPLKDVKLVDPCQIAFRKFKLRSNSLGRIADYVGIKDKKTPLDMSVWADVMLNGDAAGMNLIVKHCEADIRVLRGVLDFVKPYIKIFDDRGSAL